MGVPMQLFHGSPQVVRHPSLCAGKPDNDYGRGFYCTRDSELAKEWACKSGRDGFLNAYSFDEADLQTLDLLDGTHSVLEWIALLLRHRTFDLDSDLAVQAREYLIAHFAPNLHGVDVVIGYRADDSHFSFAESFVSNGLPLRGLGRAMRLGRLGVQVVLTSERAFSRIGFERAELVAARDHYQRLKSRDERARRQWREEVRVSGTFRDDLFVMDIIRGEVTNDDPRVRRAVSGRS